MSRERGRVTLKHPAPRSPHRALLGVALVLVILTLLFLGLLLLSAA